jgi:hypothetical protein
VLHGAELAPLGLQFRGRTVLDTTKGEAMSASFISRIGIASALVINLMVGSATNAGETATGYSWTEILVPSIGPLGLVIGINDHDQVAVHNADGSKSGIYRNGIFTPLPAFPAGSSNVSTNGINNAGAIVGGALSPSDPTHEQGFILIGSKYSFFSRPGWDNTEARAIANSGLITGFNFNGPFSNQDFSTTAGFIYNPATKTFTDATPPGSGTGFSATQGMNADGRISGDGRSPDLGRYAFIWQQGMLVKGGRKLAPFLARFKIADDGTAARGINDAGVIVGFTGSGGSVVGFVGSDSRGFQLLVPPGGDAAGAITICGGINNFSHVVCEVTDALGNNRAFIGTPDE